jgi:hypothetical protein
MGHTGSSKKMITTIRDSLIRNAHSSGFLVIVPERGKFSKITEVQMVLAARIPAEWRRSQLRTGIREL